MSTRPPKALLVGEKPEHSSNIAKRLGERGFQCRFASSCQLALSLARTCDFDVVLSPIRLDGTSLLSLMDLLVGSAVTLFYFHGVEDGCWWLPAIRRGKRCFGSSAFRPNEFLAALSAATNEAPVPPEML